MKLILEPTGQFLRDDSGRPHTRVWKGATDAGVEVYALVAGLTARRADDNSALARELMERPFPSELQALSERILGSEK